jgi:hypothetical protein
VKDQKSFFEGFNIIKKTEDYLSLDQPDLEDEMFLKLYKSIRVFKTMREDIIIEKYKDLRGIL